MVVEVAPSPLTLLYSDIDPIRTHRIREVKKREGATSQEHAFYGRKSIRYSGSKDPLNSLNRYQDPNNRIWVLQDTVCERGGMVLDFFPNPPRTGMGVS